jgi:hypothetical protein
MQSAQKTAQLLLPLVQLQQLLQLRRCSCWHQRGFPPNLLQTLTVLAVLGCRKKQGPL